jgi:membrane associated rhomboid family serine protease
MGSHPSLGFSQSGIASQIDQFPTSGSDLIAYVEQYASLLEPLSAVPFRLLFVAVTIVGVWIGLRQLLGHGLTAPLRRRLLFGMPWGTVLTASGVVAVYLFVQGAYWHSEPLVTPFRTWSYFYPFGILTGPFTHDSTGHLTGNLVGTIMYGTVVEYVWSHYPTRRGSTSFGSLRTNPFVRILLVPIVLGLVGVFTGIFSLGPIVGFSGVVFALAGFALVTRPYLFLGALLASRIIDLISSTVKTPQETVGGTVQFITPWWADIAIQGHAIGLFAGIGLGATLLWTRGERPQPGRVFFATIVFAVTNGLWAVYIPAGNNQFTLFRWLGTGLILVLSLFVAAGTGQTDERLLPELDGGWRSAAGLALLVVFGGLCLAAVPANLITITDGDAPGSGVEIRDYTITYGENIPDGYIGNIPVTNRFRPNTTTSGVIVTSSEREVWTTVIESNRLAVTRNETVVVGGTDWRETIAINRTGWAVTGNNSVYRVQLRRPNASAQTVFTSSESTVNGRVAGRTITLRPKTNRFELVVRRNGETIGAGPIPENESNARIGGVIFTRRGSLLYAGRQRTRLPIAQAR